MTDVKLRWQIFKIKSRTCLKIYLGKREAAIFILLSLRKHDAILSARRKETCNHVNTSKTWWSMETGTWTQSERIDGPE